MSAASAAALLASRPPRQCCAKPSRCSRRCQARARSAGRCPGPSIDHRACRAGPGSRRRGSAPRRRRRWRSRRRRSAACAPPVAVRKSRSASSASALQRRAGQAARLAAMLRAQRRARRSWCSTTISASMPWSIATRTIASMSPCSRSGATLRKTGGPAAARFAHRREQLVERALVLQRAQARRVGRADVDREIVGDAAPSRARPPT